MGEGGVGSIEAARKPSIGWEVRCRMNRGSVGVKRSENRIDRDGVPKKRVQIPWEIMSNWTVETGTKSTPTH